MFARLRDILKGKARSREEILPAGPIDVLDPADDEALASLIDELEGLGCVHVPAAARQRCWIVVRTEVRRRQARGAFSPVSARVKGAVHSRRVALVSTAALVAVALGIVGVLQLGGPEGGPGVVDTSVTTGTTALAEGSTTTQEPTNTTGSSATTKPQTSSTKPVSPSTSGSSVTTPGPTSTGNTGTTAPPPQTTTSRQQTTTSVPGSTTTLQMMTNEERAKSATAAAQILAQAVVNRDIGSAASVLTTSAGPGLAQMLNGSKVALVAPQSYRILQAENSAEQYTRVLVEFTDMVGGQAVTKRFVFEVKVTPSRAVITGIFDGSAQ